MALQKGDCDEFKIETTRAVMHGRLTAPDEVAFPMQVPLSGRLACRFMICDAQVPPASSMKAIPTSKIEPDEIEAILAVLGLPFQVIVIVCMGETLIYILRLST